MKKHLNSSSLATISGFAAFIVSLVLSSLVVGFDLGSRATLEFEWIKVLSDVSGFTHQRRDWYQILAVHYVSTTILFAILTASSFLRSHLIKTAISGLVLTLIVYFYYENFISVGKYSSFWINEQSNSIYYGLIDFTSYGDIVILFFVILLFANLLIQLKNLGRV